MSSPGIKNIPLYISENQNYKQRAVSRPPEGRIAIVTTRWARDAMDAAFQRRMVLLRTAKSCGPDAAMLASSLWSDLQVTVTTSPLHRGEHEVSRKAIAQGMSECFRSPVCSCAPNAQLLAHETAGAVGTRLSLRPLFKRGPTNLQKLGQIMPRDRGRSE